MRPSGGRRAVLFALAIAGFLATRVALLGRQGLWADEYFSLAMATGHGLEQPAADSDPASGDFVEAAEPVAPAEYARYLRHESPPAGPARIVRAVERSDTSPPLYYLLLSGWTRLFGTSDVALRAFSLLCAVASLPLVALLARRTGGRAAVVPACVLFIVLPAAVYYSTEGRMYSLLWLETTACAALATSLQRRRSGWALAGLVAVAAAGLWTHYAFAFVLAAMSGVLLLKPGALGRGRLVAAGVAIGLLALPWYAHLGETFGHWRVTDYWLKLRPGRYEPVRAIAELGWSFFSLHGMVDVPRRLELAQMAVVGSIAAASAFMLRRRWLSARRWMAAACVVAAIAGLVLLDALQHTYLVAVHRYALAGLPAALLLVGTALGSLRPRLRYALLAVVAATSVWSVSRMHAMRARTGESYRQLGDRLAEGSGPDDVIFVHSIPSGVAGFALELERACGGRPGAPLFSWVSQLGTRKAPDDVVRAIAGRRRAIHVSIHAVGGAPDAERWLRDHARLAAPATRLGSAQLEIFEPSSGDRF